MFWGSLSGGFRVFGPACLTHANLFAQYCSWQEEAYMCRNKSDLGNIPCHDLSEHGACNAQKGCQWYPTSQRCLAPDAELPCDHRWSQESCDEEVGKDKCTWVANANACIKTGESISCHQIYQDDGCKATEGCG